MSISPMVTVSHDQMASVLQAFGECGASQQEHMMKAYASSGSAMRAARSAYWTSCRVSDLRTSMCPSLLKVQPSLGITVQAPKTLTSGCFGSTHLNHRSLDLSVFLCFSSSRTSSRTYFCNQLSYLFISLV